MLNVTKIRFGDVSRREIDERDRTTKRIEQLDQYESVRVLSQDETDERNRLTQIRDLVDDNWDEVCEPLFVGIRELFNQKLGVLGVQLKAHSETGILAFEPQAGAAAKLARRGNNAAADVKDAVVLASLTIGLCILDGTPAPLVEVVGKQTVPIKPSKVRSSPNWDLLFRGFYKAVGDAQSMFNLAAIVLPLLAREGDPRGSDDPSPGTVDAKEFAAVMVALKKQGVTEDQPQLRRKVNECLDSLQGVDDGGNPMADLGAGLFDLESINDADIVPNNVNLMGTMVCSAMFDELKVFQVVDKLVELFQQGTLPIGSGAAGELLYRYWKDSPNRMSEAERKNFYAMTMGIPGGNAGAMANRDFNDLWLRFVSSVSAYVRQSEVDKLLRQKVPNGISQQQVRKSARDLATNLSLHGYGMAFYAARDLRGQIRMMMDLLGDPEIRSAYGARDMWQVIDQVATLELGGAKTSSRFRTLAICGGIITSWLANNVARIIRPTVSIIDIDAVRAPIPASNGLKATSAPSDYDLVNACELWLADTATSDNRIEEMAQPREAPVMTSKPVQIPTIARDMLDDIGGIGGMGMAFGSNRRH
jgi:hypothetical protein